MLLIHPNLPQNKVKTVVISSRYENICEVYSLGIKVIKIEPNVLLPDAVCTHADMNLCFVGQNKIFILKDQKNAVSNLEREGYSISYILKEVGNKYPDDVKLNCAFMGNKVIMNTQTISSEILDYCHENGLKIINVNQGYTKCSILILNENAAITSDEGIYKALCEEKIDVLKIRAGYIKIDKYDYGFIGGTAGLIDKNLILFCGDITLHPDYREIHKFLNKYGIKEHCLSGVITDVGGIIPLN